MKSLAEQLRNKYITENLECSTIVNYDKADISKTYLFKDLPDLSINGYPFAADFISDKGVAYGMQDWLSVSEEEKKRCTLRFHYLPCCHEIYLGCTGSGKTTGCIEPQLRALSSQKNKPDLFITDPKGELFDHNARHLKDNGYRAVRYRDETPRYRQGNPHRDGRSPGGRTYALRAYRKV